MTGLRLDSEGAETLSSGLMAQVNDILQKSLSPTTWSQYAKIWSDLERFSRTVLETPSPLSVLPFQAIIFLASLHQKGLVGSTIHLSGSAISFLHKRSAGSNDLIPSCQIPSRTLNANASQDV